MTRWSCGRSSPRTLAARWSSRSTTWPWSTTWWPTPHAPRTAAIRSWSASARLLADRRPTVVFSTRRETVRHLRDRLAPPPVAWCTGERAGLGLLPAPRAAVLGWFRDELAWDAPGLAPPSCLVVTDVAAEGLDLRRAARVVHYDLPWTPMRLEQREGRAVRLGSARELVEVVRFIPPPALDAALDLGERLRRKAALPALAGLGADGVRLWRWRSALADQLGDGPAVSGSALACGARGCRDRGRCARLRRRRRARGLRAPRPPARRARAHRLGGRLARARRRLDRGGVRRGRAPSGRRGVRQPVAAGTGSHPAGARPSRCPGARPTRARGRTALDGGRARYGRPAPGPATG